MDCRAALCSYMAAWVLLSLTTASAAASPLKLVLVPDDSHRGAACLDGSPPGYFIRKGTGAAATNFIIHAQGGGWCWDTEERADAGHSCHTRAQTGLGSSKFWTADPPSTGTNWYCCNGILSGNATENPHFFDWTMVFVNYCDGSSLTGNRSEAYNGLHYRGRANLDAVLDHLIATESVGRARQVVWTGGSAGGLAVYLNADHVAARLPGVSVKALADGGFFMDHRTFEGADYARQIYSTGFMDLWESASTANRACIASNPTAMWKCAFAQYTLPHIATPVYVVEGMYDPWQLEFTLQLDGGPPHGPAPHPICLNNVWAAGWTPKNCTSAQFDGMLAFGRDMRGNITAALQPKDSAFVPACVIHCQSILTVPWMTWSLHNLSLHSHFSAWLRGGTAAATPLIDDREYAARSSPCSET